MNKNEINKIINQLKEDNIFDNTNDIIKFLNKNYKDIKETLLYNTGGGCMIFYVNLNDSIYSISDEPLPNNTDTIIYKGIDEFYFPTINDFLMFEEDSYPLTHDDLNREYIKI
jgi:hypothetical protein